VIFVDSGFFFALFSEGDPDHGRVVEVGDVLYSEKLARIHRASFEEEKSAFEYLRRHRDKRYSAVDCLSRVGASGRGGDAICQKGATKSALASRSTA
jgi:predicted nucleic acid-binding protein